MKAGTHNLGRNAHGQLVIVRLDEGGMRLQAGTLDLLLTADQAQLLKDVLA